MDLLSLILISISIGLSLSVKVVVSNFTVNTQLFPFKDKSDTVSNFNCFISSPESISISLSSDTLFQVIVPLVLSFFILIVALLLWPPLSTSHDVFVISLMHVAVEAPASYKISIIILYLAGKFDVSKLNFHLLLIKVIRSALLKSKVVSKIK